MRRIEIKRLGLIAQPREFHPGFRPRFCGTLHAPWRRRNARFRRGGLMQKMLHEIKHARQSLRPACNKAGEGEA